MCGIAGIFAYHYAAPPLDRDELRAIRDHMVARGPDGLGEWFETTDASASATGGWPSSTFPTALPSPWRAPTASW
jgi:asparagine synthetase B (glutamine-hydrolysing)